MSQFVQRSNLPRDASAVIIGEKYTEILSNSLENLGICPVIMPDNPYVDIRLSGHADLSVFHAGGERIYLAPYLKGTDFYNQLLKLGADIIFPELTQDAKYPRDAPFNACAVGNLLICSNGVTASDIVEFFTNRREADILYSRQGYAKCSTCVIDEHSIITADLGIARAAKKSDLDVLVISQGYIDLPGFSYGFLGGAAFRLSDYLMAFTGVLDRHPDKQSILKFIRARGLEAVYLTDKTIFDIGSAVPILERPSRK